MDTNNKASHMIIHGSICFRILIFFLALFIFIPLTATAETDLTNLKSNYRINAAPTIDGTVGTTEWQDAYEIHLVPNLSTTPFTYPIEAYIYFLNDDTFLYVLVDAIGDTTESNNDECLMIFDLPPNHKVAEIYYDNKTIPASASTATLATETKFQKGFSTSPNSATSHRCYEFRIRLDYIGISPGDSIEFYSPPALKHGYEPYASIPYDADSVLIGGTYYNRDNIFPYGITVTATWSNTLNAYVLESIDSSVTIPTLTTSVDECPTDPDKVSPGDCGCGVADTDSDSDGTPDCNDNCDSDPDKTETGTCGCGVADTDSDSDGTPDCNDNCDSDPNKTEPGTCGCGVADTDSDSDGTPDCNDNCPSDPAKTEPGDCGCGIPDTDSENDGVMDCIENGAPGSDGNDDGKDDGTQGNVTSLLDANNNNYITVEVSGGCSQNLEVTAFTCGFNGGDPGFAYPCELVGFKLECSSATIRIIYHGIPSLDGYTYRKFGPVAPDFDGESQWYTLPGVTFGTVEIDDVTTAYAEFTLQDGQLGDDTGVEGIIIDQGGPAIESSAEIPTLNDWGLILLMILMGFFALHASKNRQRTNA